MNTQRPATSLGLRVLLAALIPFATHAATNAPVEDAIREARARIVADFVPKVPALSVAAGRAGKMIWSEAFGFADLKAKTPATPKTLFRIGSISKPLTAVGLMLLVEQDGIDLDADIHRYIPDFPDKGHTITTRQLAGHLAGVRHYQAKEMFLNKHFATLREGLKIFENDPLLSMPGTKYSYSSYGWNLIGAEIESITKQEFPSYMEHAVFAPLAMQHTIADFPNRDIPDRAHPYDLQPGGGFKPSPDVDNSFKWSSGGFLSTPEDLVRFGSALLHPGLLKRESLHALFTSQATDDGKKTGYGIGWVIRQDTHGHRIFLHTGGSIGGTSILSIFPDSGIVLAMTSNCSTSPFNKADLDAVSDKFSELTSAE